MKYLNLKLPMSIVGAILFVMPAFAQAPASYTFTVTAAEADIISDGLQTQPFGKVFPLINKLREQIITQQPKPEAPKPVADPPKVNE